MASKPKPKHEAKDEPRPEEAKPPPRPPRQHVQMPQAQPSPARAPAQPLAYAPRPLFTRRGDQQVPADAQAVINALQQTVRSQAVLIRNYQELLRLDGRPVEGADEGEDEGEAA